MFKSEQAVQSRSKLASSEVLAESTACYRGFRGWAQKTSDIALVNYIVPDYFSKRVTLNLSLDDKRELMELRSNFANVFKHITDKDRQVSDVDLAVTASLIELAKKWIDRRVDHFHELATRAPEGLLKRIAQKSVAQQKVIAEKVHLRFDKILKAIGAS